MLLQNIYRTYRKKIIFGVSLVFIEKIAWIIEPTVFGDVIDAMITTISHSTTESPIIPLIIWTSIFAINSGVGSYRRIKDEQIYLRIHTDLAVRISENAIKGKTDPPRAAARSELSREVINFFQYRMPEMMEQAIDIIGATIALGLFDWRLAATCLGVLIPTVIFSQIYNRKVLFYQSQLHDQQEEVYTVYSQRDSEQVRIFYTDMAKWKQKIANWGAFNFGMMRIILLGIFLIILYVAIDLDDFTTGNIYSVAAYVWTFVSSSEYLPEQMESWMSVKDMSKRLDTDDAAVSI